MVGANDQLSENAGDLLASQWTEAYQAGVVIGMENGSQMPPPHITVNNSNAIVGLHMSTSNVLALTQTNSNAINYLNARINSGYLGPTRYIEPSNPLVATSNMVYNASNNIVQFSSGSNLIEVSPGQTLTMQNVILNDFTPDSFMQSPDQGNLIFGDKTVLNLGINFSGGSSDILTLNYTWTLTGRATIEGKNRTLVMGPLGNIVTMPGSQLSINNLLIRNVQGNNIRCLTDNASIYLSAVQLMMSDSFSFTTGSLIFCSESALTGQATFAYQSVMPSTILPYSSLMISSRTTFSYDPIDGNQTGLTFGDQTAVLFLNGATVHVTKGGMQLKNGTVSINDTSSFYVEGGIDESGGWNEKGLIFGNNNSPDDCIIDFDRDALLNIYGGALLYRNMFLGSWQMNGYASMLRIQPGAMLMLDQSLNVGEGRVMLSNSANFQLAPGAQLIGSLGYF